MGPVLRTTLTPEMAEPSASRHDEAVVAEATEYAVKFHQLGMLAEAEKFYDAILQIRPDDFRALHMLGILRQQQGNNVEALRLTSAALDTNSRAAATLSTFGALLGTLKRHEEALAAHEKMLALRKDRADALVSYGIALVHLGRDQEALEAFDGALAINESHFEARINRGVALTRLGRLGEALETLDAALAIDERHPEVLVNRGVVLMHLGRPQESLTAFDTAIEIKPDHPKALGNRVLALVALGRQNDVLDSCDKALAVNPGDAETLHIQGNTLWSSGKLEAALASYERAQTLGHARALSMLALYRLTIADWANVDNLSESLSARIAAGDFIYPFTSVVFGFDARDQLRAAKNYLRACLPVAPKPLSHAGTLHSDKLRIAYVSSDFRQHAVASSIAELFERHDRTRFEVIGISLSPGDNSTIRARIVKSFDLHHDAATFSDENIAKMLNDLDVHIAIDLNGPTQWSRPGVWAHRAAPVQVTYLGYPATTGAEFIDYVLADETVLPFDQQPFFTEKIVHLPDCYHANDTTRRLAVRIPARRDVGLPENGMVFCCFNKSSKITAPVFDRWMRVLKRIPDSVLWLSQTNYLALANLRREAEARNIDPDRLVFAPHVEGVDHHLTRHRLADLFLDTLPYNAHSTAIDALFAGLPVVTCAGGLIVQIGQGPTAVSR